MFKRRLSQQLMLGTAMTAAFTAPVFAAEEVRQEIVVEGRRIEPYRIEKPSLSKLTGPLRDTPQGVDVVTGQLMEDRGITNLNDAFRSVPGITLGAGEFNWQGNNPNIRGFNSRSDIFLDGMRDFGNYYRDPFNYESVEVLKGPASMVFGRGSTGGAINQVSKHANLSPRIFGGLNFGTDSTKRAAVDFNQPLPELGEGGAIRLNAMGHDGAVAGRDGGEQSRWGMAASLALGLGTPTRLGLDYVHQSNNDVPDYGLPWFGTQVAQVPRSNYYGFNSDYQKAKADIVTARVDHDFSESLMLHSQLRYGHYSRINRITEPQIAAAVGTPLANVTVNRNVYTGQGEETFLQWQNDVKATLETGFITHDVVAGFEVGRERSAPWFGFAQGVPGTNLLNPAKDAIFVSTGTPPNIIADTTGDGFGVYVLDTIKLHEMFQLVAGVRWDSFRVDYSAQRYAATTGAYVSSDAIIHKDQEFSYRAGAIFKPMEQGTVYFSFATSFNPSAEGLTFLTAARGTFPIGNAFLDPEKNKTFELGTKWEFLDGKLAADAAVFRITKDNARVPNPTTPGFNTLGGTQRADGFDVSIKGSITNEWQLTAGYVYLKTKVTQSPTGVTGAPPAGAPLPFAPANAFSFWSTYDITPAIQIGGGAQYVDSRFATNTAPVKQVPGYWTFDAMAKYNWSQHISFKVNLTNLTDKYYYDAIHPQHVLPGPGRTAMFAINVTY
jgi:catecholate siderophore receptor